MSQRADTGTFKSVPSHPSHGTSSTVEDSGSFGPTDTPDAPPGSDTTQFPPATSAMPSGPETEVIPNAYAPPPSADSPPSARHVSAQDETTLLQTVPALPPPPFRAVTPPGGPPPGGPPPGGPPPGLSSLPGELPGGAAGSAGTATAIAPPASLPSAAHRSSTVGMWVSVVVFWLLAMPIGVMSAVIVAGRRATLCSKSSTGFGCTSTGSSVGMVLLVILVAVVGTVSVYAYDVRHHARRWLAGLGIGVALLAVLGLIAWLLVRTIQ